MSSVFYVFCFRSGECFVLLIALRGNGRRASVRSGRLTCRPTDRPPVVNHPQVDERRVFFAPSFSFALSCFFSGVLRFVEIPGRLLTYIIEGRDVTFRKNKKITNWPWMMTSPFFSGT